MLTIFLVIRSFLDQVGSEEESPSPPSLQPAAEDSSSSSSSMDVPSVGRTNITDLITESYEVRSTETGTDTLTYADDTGLY